MSTVATSSRRGLPGWIGLLDDCYFLVATPVFEFLLTGYSVANVLEVLVVDETIDVVAAGIGFRSMFSMLRHAGEDIVGEAYV